MCVIAIIDQDRPTDEMVEKMFEHNNAGAGIAWREGEAGNKKVVWHKGLELPEVKQLCKDVPMPYVVHFRIPSVGGKRVDLCHPFPIDKQVPLAVRGSTKGYVLFHNGHWADWKTTMLRSVVGTNFKIPMGKWSDSRAMAWMAAHYNIGVLEMIDEKCVAFGPDDIEVLSKSGDGWSFVDKIWVSNRYWSHGVHTTVYGSGLQSMCREVRCTKKNLDITGYCPEHTKMTRQPGEGEKSDKNGNKAASAEASGGASTVNPFGQMSPMAWMKAQEDANRLGELSNKKLKKCRKVYEKWLNSLKTKDFRMPVSPAVMH